MDGPVKVVDATHVILSDTVENQRYFPQSENAKPGCGFPVARIMGLFSAQSGALLGHGVVGRDVAEIMAFEGEIVPLLQSDDILVADRQYSVYWIFGRMLEQGVDVVIRKNGSVKTLKTIRCLRARRDRLVPLVQAPTAARKPDRRGVRFTTTDTDLAPGHRDDPQPGGQKGKIAVAHHFARSARLPL